MITSIHNMIYSKSKTNYDITRHLFNNNNHKFTTWRKSRLRLKEVKWYQQRLQTYLCQFLQYG